MLRALRIYLMLALPSRGPQLLLCRWVTVDHSAAGGGEGGLQKAPMGSWPSLTSQNLLLLRYSHSQCCSPGLSAALESV